MSGQTQQFRAVSGKTVLCFRLDRVACLDRQFWDILLGLGRVACLDRQNRFGFGETQQFLDRHEYRIFWGWVEFCFCQCLDRLCGVVLAGHGGVTCIRS